MTLTCIKCGTAADKTLISVDVDTGEISCNECSAVYTAADVRAVLAAWAPVLDWIEAFPARKGGAGGAT